MQTSKNTDIGSGINQEPSASGCSSAGKLSASVKLRPPQIVIKESGPNCTPTRLAINLAKYSFFGVEELKMSTVSGKAKGLSALDPRKLMQLKETIRSNPPLQTEEDFKKTWKDIKTSLRQCCKNHHHLAK